MNRIVITIFTLICVLAPVKADEALDNYGKGVKLYWDGKGKEALPFLEKSLGLGMTDAAYVIGECYTWGIGMAKNYSKAERYYKIAAKSNKSDAQYIGEAQFALFILYKLNVSSLSYEEANDYLIAAANNGVSDALYELGLYYKRHAKFGLAQKAMNEAAEKGNVHALCLLGIAWYEGNGIWTGDAKNYDKAFKYLNEAVEDDYLERAAMTDDMKCATFFTLSKCYRFGRGVKANLKKAQEYTKEAAKYGDANDTTIKLVLNNL